MKRILWRGSGVLLLLVLALAAYVWVDSAMALHRTWHVDEPALALPTDAGAIARGERIAASHGCTDCHGADGGGGVLLEGSPLGRIAPPNLTPGQGSVILGFTVADWEHVIRHGIKPDGRGLLFMPVRDFAGLTDADTADLIAYLRQLPAVDHEQAPTRVGPLGRTLFAFGKLPLIEARMIDQHAPHVARLTAAPTAAYGGYLAQMCVSCHGEHLSGGAIPGMPPDFPAAANITPDDASGIGRWSKADFHAVLREGRRPDGSAVDPAMPWRATRHFSDVEIDALWAYLNTVPARPAGTH